MQVSVNAGNGTKGFYPVYDTERTNGFATAWNNLPEGITIEENKRPVVKVDTGETITYELGTSVSESNYLHRKEKMVERDKYDAAMKEAITECDIAIQNPKYHFPKFEVSEGSINFEELVRDRNPFFYNQKEKFSRLYKFN